jgi:hypothetical protein
MFEGTTGFPLEGDVGVLVDWGGMEVGFGGMRFAASRSYNCWLDVEIGRQRRRGSTASLFFRASSACQKFPAPPRPDIVRVVERGVELIRKIGILEGRGEGN